MVEQRVDRLPAAVDEVDDARAAAAAASSSSNTLCIVIGTLSDGLRTTVLPQAIA